MRSGVAEELQAQGKVCCRVQLQVVLARASSHVSSRMVRCRGGKTLCGVLFRVLPLCAALCSPTPAPAGVGGGSCVGRPATASSASLVCLRGGTSPSKHGASGQAPDGDRGSRRSAQRRHVARDSKDAGEPRRYNLRHRHQCSVPPPSPSGSGRPLRSAVSPPERRVPGAGGCFPSLTSLQLPLLCCAVLRCVRIQGGSCGMDARQLTSSGRRRIGRARGGGVKARSSAVSRRRSLCLLSAPRPWLSVHAPLPCPSFFPQPRLSERECKREGEGEEKRVGRAVGREGHCSPGGRVKKDMLCQLLSFHER